MPCGGAGPGVDELLRWLALVLAVANLVNKQAFYNQFWLVGALVAASLALPQGEPAPVSGRRPEPAATASPTRLLSRSQEHFAGSGPYDPDAREVLLTSRRGRGLSRGSSRGRPSRVSHAVGQLGPGGAEHRHQRPRRWRPRRRRPSRSTRPP